MAAMVMVTYIHMAVRQFFLAASTSSGLVSPISRCFPFTNAVYIVHNRARHAADHPRQNLAHKEANPGVGEEP